MIHRKRSALLIGSFSGGNYGDSLILVSLLKNLYGRGFDRVIIPTASIQTISQFVASNFRNDSLKIEYVDINMRKNLGYRFLNFQVIQKLESVDFIIFTAGTIFFRTLFDPRKNFVFSVYLLWFFIRKYKIKLIGLFVGINEDYSELSTFKKFVSRNFFSLFSFVVTRDLFSYKNIKHNKLVSEVYRSYDIGLYSLLKENISACSDKEGNIIGLNICEYLGNQVGIKVDINVLIQFIDKACEKYSKVYWFHTTARDKDFVEKIIYPLLDSDLLEKSSSILLYQNSQDERKYLELSKFIGMRMHSLIPAIAMKVPTFALNYNSKVKALFKDLEGEDFVIDLDNLSNYQDHLSEDGFKISKSKQLQILDSVEKIFF